jgi:CHAD domain-containing protein
MKPASPTALPHYLAACVKAQRRRYRKRLERCQRKFSESAVHELRIQTRRLLALLNLSGALYGEDAPRKICKVLKRRLDAFDELRDTHVQLLLLKGLRVEFPEVRELDAWLRRREGKLVSALRHGIKAARQARLEKRLKALEKTLRKLPAPRAHRNAADPARTAMAESFADVVALRRRIRRRDPRTIHRTRVAFKRYRYMAELLRPFLPGVTPELVLRMRRYQARMGDIQDLEVLLAGLALADKKRRLEPGLARRLRPALRQRRARLVDDYLHNADELFDFEPSRLVQPAAETQTSTL